MKDEHTIDRFLPWLAPNPSGHRRSAFVIEALAGLRELRVNDMVFDKVFAVAYPCSSETCQSSLVSNTSSSSQICTKCLCPGTEQAKINRRAAVNQSDVRGEGDAEVCNVVGGYR